jgi:hypothetical protein
MYFVFRYVIFFDLLESVALSLIRDASSSSQSDQRVLVADESASQDRSP